MNKSELIAMISEKTGLAKTQVSKTLDELIKVIVSNVSSGKKVAIAGLGIFEKKYREARVGVNPSTQESIKIAAKSVPSFKAAKSFKDLVK